MRGGKGREVEGGGEVQRSILEVVGWKGRFRREMGVKCRWLFDASWVC